MLGKNTAKEWKKKGMMMRMVVMVIMMYMEIVRTRTNIMAMLNRMMVTIGLVVATIVFGDYEDYAEYATYEDDVYYDDCDGCID